MMLKLLSSGLLFFAFSGCATKSVHNMDFREVTVQAKKASEIDEFATNMQKTINDLDEFKYSVNKTSRVQKETEYLNSFESFILEQTRDKQ